MEISVLHRCTLRTQSQSEEEHQSEQRIRAAHSVNCGEGGRSGRLLEDHFHESQSRDYRERTGPWKEAPGLWWGRETEMMKQPGSCHLSLSQLRLMDSCLGSGESLDCWEN